MAMTLILAEKTEAARAKACELLASVDGEKSYVFVPWFEGTGSGDLTVPELEGFDAHKEPVILGSRLAQQCSWVDAVLAEGLERWSQNLHARYPGDAAKIDTERISLLAVLDNSLADIVLISKPIESAGITDRDARSFLERCLEDLKGKVDEVIVL